MRPIVRDQVVWSVCLSLGVSVTLVSPAKTAEPIDMPFGLRTRVGPRVSVLDRGSDPPIARGNFEGKGHAGWLVTPRGGKWARPPLALWWHYRPRRTSEFFVMRGAMWLFVKLRWPLVVVIVISGPRHIVSWGHGWHGCTQSPAVLASTLCHHLSLPPWPDGCFTV